MGEYIVTNDSARFENQSILMATSPFHRDVLEQQQVKNVFPENASSEEIGDVVEFSAPKNDEEEMCIAARRDYKIRKGDFWYNIVKKEYGITKHEMILEIVHILKDANNVDYNKKLMPSKIELLSEIILNNGEMVALLNPPMEKCQKHFLPPMEEENTKTVNKTTIETPEQNEDDCIPEEEQDKTQDSQATNETQEKSFPNTLKDMPNHYKIAEVKSSTTTFGKNGEPKTVVNKFFTNVEVIELEPAQKDETGQIIKDRTVVFKCDQGIFVEDKDGLPGGEPIPEDVFEEFLQITKE